MTRPSDELDVQLASVDTRVTGVEREQHRLNNAVTSLQGEVRIGFDSIRAALSDQHKTPWAVLFSGLAFILSLCVVIGGLAYWPINTAQHELKGDLKEMRRDYIDLLKERR